MNRLKRTEYSELVTAYHRAVREQIIKDEYMRAFGIPPPVDYAYRTDLNYQIYIQNGQQQSVSERKRPESPVIYRAHTPPSQSPDHLICKRRKIASGYP